MRFCCHHDGHGQRCSLARSTLAASPRRSSSLNPFAGTTEVTAGLPSVRVPILSTTAIAVLAFGVETGIMAGVGVSIALYLWRTSRPHVAIVGQVPGTEHYRNILRHSVITSPAFLMRAF